MSGAMSWPFLRLYLLTLLYFSANAILNVIIPLQGAAWGASGTTIGIIMGAYMFTTMFFRPWAGQWIQKYGPIRVLRIILLVNAAALILYSFTGLGGYLVARILQGVSTAFFSMALQIGIIDALPEKDRSQGISFYSLFSYIPGIIGPVFAIGFWQTNGMDSISIILILIAISTGLFGYAVKMDPATGSSDTPTTNSGVFQSFGQIIKNPLMFKCSVLMLSSSIVFGAVTTFMPLYGSQLESGHAGIYLMLQAAVVVAARFMLRKRIPSDGRWHSWFVMGIMFLISLASLCISISQLWGSLFLYAGAIVMGIAQALLYPTLTTYLSFVLPQQSRNVLIGLFIAMADLGVSLGGVVMGPIADVLSYSSMYLICAALGLIMIVFAYGRRDRKASRSRASEEENVQRT
ncbi:staphylopine family metallophore export MFS transporter CntE [Paenibacillus sp. MDMC362]|uniref:staphylopine family metallophore export MFS transporter CntE n=1 Tax=Paenibacillus sp. MDMC362 TaxID=2977365 RepID=UPI000DC41A14|nr:MFS transporter [Paenibacillus sp. MDMC362]RAR42230.1 MFS transporter [Paenibacillus sp. MDMC362]